MSETSGNDLKLELTDDGSHTLFSSRFDQHYHNPDGAVAESRYVFLQSTDLFDALRDQETVHILEVGFGTGLNLALLADVYHSLNSTSQLVYHSIEAYPLSPEIVAGFNYGKFLDHPGITDKIAAIFDLLSPGMNQFQFPGNIEVKIFNGLFRKYNPGTFKPDYIFHDPFSPRTNPKLWTGEVFKKLLKCSRQGALLTTYCAASKARGAMAWAGWKVARREGALRKREMTVASPDPGRLSTLEMVNTGRLARRYDEGDF